MDHNYLSWKCPRHVPNMSLGQGHVLKSQGQNQMASHILCIFSFMCTSESNTGPLFHLEPKNLLIIQIFQVHLPNSSIQFILPEFFFWNYKTNINSKITNRGVKKRLVLQTQKVHHKANLISSLLCPSWSCQKITFLFFIF